MNSMDNSNINFFEQVKNYVIEGKQIGGSEVSSDASSYAKKAAMSYFPQAVYKKSEEHKDLTFLQKVANAAFLGFNFTVGLPFFAGNAIAMKVIKSKSEDTESELKASKKELIKAIGNRLQEKVKLEFKIAKEVIQDGSSIDDLTKINKRINELENKFVNVYQKLEIPDSKRDFDNFYIARSGYNDMLSSENDPEFVLFLMNKRDAETEKALNFSMGVINELENEIKIIEEKTSMSEESVVDASAINNQKYVNISNDATEQDLINYKDSYVGLYSAIRNDYIEDLENKIKYFSDLISYTNRLIENKESQLKDDQTKLIALINKSNRIANRESDEIMLESENNASQILEYAIPKLENEIAVLKRSLITLDTQIEVSESKLKNLNKKLS